MWPNESNNPPIHPHPGSTKSGDGPNHLQIQMLIQTMLSSRGEVGTRSSPRWEDSMSEPATHPPCISSSMYQHYKRPHVVDAVQRTKEPLHAAYLNTPSLETRNCQSLLSSFSTSARHSATHGYATNQDHAASLSRHRRACSCKDGTLVGELEISALLEERMSVIQ